MEAVAPVAVEVRPYSSPLLMKLPRMAHTNYNFLLWQVLVLPVTVLLMTAMLRTLPRTFSHPAYKPHPPLLIHHPF